MEVESLNRLTEKIIGCAIEVHKTLGPGLLENVYSVCLAHELFLNKISFQREIEIPVIYKGIRIESGYRLDFLIEDSVILELKTVDKLSKIHSAQILTYLKVCDKRLGLLINFNEVLLKNGIKRIVNDF